MNILGSRIVRSRMCDVNINSNYYHEKLLNRAKYLPSNIFITFPIYNKISYAVILVPSFANTRDSYSYETTFNLICPTSHNTLGLVSTSETLNLILVHILLLKHNFTIFIW